MEQPQEAKQSSPSNERLNDEIPRLPYNLNAITVYASNNMFLVIVCSWQKKFILESLTLVNRHLCKPDFLLIEEQEKSQN